MPNNVYRWAFALLFAAGLAAALLQGCENERLRYELALARQRQAALVDSTRILYEDSLKTVAARVVMPDLDSLEAAVTEEVRRVLKEEGGSAREVVRVVYQERPVQTDGTVAALPDSLDGIPPDSLRFTVADTVGIYSVSADLTVHLPRRSLDYRFRITPRAQEFRLYTLDSGDLREVWVEAPGLVRKVDAYMRPQDVRPYEPRQTFALGASAGMSPLGRYSETALSYDRKVGPLWLGARGGVGFYASGGGPATVGPHGSVGVRLILGR